MLRLNMKFIYRLAVALFLFASIIPIQASEYEDKYLEGIKYFERQDYNKAFSIFKPLADNGYMHAQLLLGYMYTDGLGVSKNKSKGISFFEKAASQGSSDAQYTLGEIFRTGDGTSKNLKRAFQYHLEAANSGDADSQFLIGIMYYMGDGVKQSYEGAVKWFSQARYQGYGQEAKEWHEKSCLQLYNEVNFVASKMPKVCENI